MFVTLHLRIHVPLKGCVSLYQLLLCSDVSTRVLLFKTNKPKSWNTTSLLCSLLCAVFQRGGVVAVDMMNCVSLCCLMTGKDSSHQRDACNMQFYLVKFVNGERQLHLDPVWWCLWIKKIIFQVKNVNFCTKPTSVFTSKRHKWFHFINVQMIQYLTREQKLVKKLRSWPIRFICV